MIFFYIPQNKNSIANVSLFPLPCQRNYFGSEHGKGEADGETGRFSQALRIAVGAGMNFQSAKDMVAFGASKFQSRDTTK